jgi:ABC-type Fe3+/spermidine/putrescine transport system ATPase subunit
LSKTDPIIKLTNLTKRFGDVIAVDNVNLEIQNGEILSLLGPSGCGKSTTLRTIAGLEFANSGKVYFEGEDITGLPVRKRDMAMVFQSYALWPHMTVFRNVEYGLTLANRQVPREEREERVERALKMVQADELIERKPSELSGGQQQRIAVARAIVVNPSVLLLDEPFSNLDAKLRVETRSEIRTLIKKLGLTCIFVTHDQAEALSISDRIAVMNKGRIEQLGTPDEIWETPDNAFVGTFIGEANLVVCRVEEVTPGNGEAILSVADSDEKFKTSKGKGLESQETAQVVLRPEKLTISREKDPSKNQMKAKAINVMFMGVTEHITAELPDKSIIKIHRSDLDFPISAGDDIYISIDPDKAYAYGGEYKMAIHL